MAGAPSSCSARRARRCRMFCSRTAPVMENRTAALSILLLSRAFAGMCGGDVAVAQAYIADITPPENRSKRMGLIGMAFGFGFHLRLRRSAASR